MAEGADAAAMNRSIPSKALDDSDRCASHERPDAAPSRAIPYASSRPAGRYVGGRNGCAASRSAISDGSHARRRRRARTPPRKRQGAQIHFVMDAKSVITSPSPQAPVKQSYQRYSGGGVWSRQDQAGRCSLDGGRENWRTARITAWFGRHVCVSITNSIGMEKSFYCSRAPWTRTGYVQPSKDALRKKLRWRQSIYDNNGIDLGDRKSGCEVENVEVG